MVLPDGSRAKAMSSTGIGGGAAYLPFLPPGRWARALPAALFELFEVRPSRRTFDAAEAAFLPVTLPLPRAIWLSPPLVAPDPLRRGNPKRSYFYFQV